MTAIIVSRVRVCSVAVVILFYAIDAVVAQPVTGIKLNDNAVAFATQLINEGHFMADGKGAWREHRPSADQENEFIRVHGFGEYCTAHRAVVQLGRTLEWGSRGRGFKSRQPDWFPSVAV